MLPGQGRSGRHDKRISVGEKLLVHCKRYMVFSKVRCLNWKPLKCENDILESIQGPFYGGSMLVRVRISSRKLKPKLEGLWLQVYE